ncbi:MAG TPA: hypothetical protein VKU02_19330, partial [Gemmataceae bacterium]|nr:hypothetical protein [Gemmataceae bacterium]
QHLASSGTGRKTEIPARLTESERAAFIRCSEHNLRIEQERLPHTEIVAAMKNLLEDTATACV